MFWEAGTLNPTSVLGLSLANLQPDTELAAPADLRPKKQKINACCFKSLGFGVIQQ